MSRQLSLRTRTILVVSSILLIFHVISLGLYILLSAMTVTLEREEQIADRIVTATRLIEQAHPDNRQQLARQLSGERFVLSVDPAALDEQDELESGAEVTELIGSRFAPLEHVVAADYVKPGVREISAQRSSGPFRIHETLIVSVDLPDGEWLNIRVSGSAWDHIIAPATIPSLTLMTIVIIVIVAWAVSRPLRTLSRLARASDEMGADVSGAVPLDESGPIEISRVAKAFNHMQERVQRLLRARNELLGAISHDFRTPLTRLRLRVERIEDPDQREKAIADIEEMESLMQFTLEFARDNAEAQRHETVNCHTLVNEVIALSQASRDRIEVDIPHNLQVECHPLGLRRVVTNLVNNALFYGGRVRVSGYESESNLILDVDDDGPGIAPEDRKRVFAPFFRLEDSRNRVTAGAGLGLAIAETIVNAHGGQIHLRDSELGGLKVHVCLPGLRN